MLIVKNQNESFSQLENIQYLLILRVINTPAGLYRLIRLINITKETGKHTAHTQHTHTHTHTETKDQRPKIVVENPPSRLYWPACASSLSSNKIFGPLNERMKGVLVVSSSAERSLLY
jgi:hypothetical protein